MCVTLWQDFIGADFLASLAPQRRPGSTSSNTLRTHDGISNSIGDKDSSHANKGEGEDWTLDLHSVAAASKPSPYLPMCMVATKQSSWFDKTAEAPSGGREGTSAGDRNGARVAAWCDRAGRPLVTGGEPSELLGEQEVSVTEAEGPGAGSTGDRITLCYSLC